MSEIELSRDSLRLLAILYRHYRQQRKAGRSISQARCLGDIDALYMIASEYYTREDTTELCRELGIAGCLINNYASGKIYRSTLSDQGIRYMESNPHRKLKEILEIIAPFIP